MNKYSVKLLAKAERDLDLIYNYIVSEFKEVEIAENLVDKMEENILGLEFMPYRGAVRKVGAFANKGYRQLFVKNYTIVYRIDEAKKMVVVVTIRYTASNF